MGGIGLIFTPVLARHLLRLFRFVWAYDYSSSWTHSYSKQSYWKVYGDKSLKMPSDSISESVIFQNFLGACPRPPNIDSAYPSYPHINNADTSGCAPLFKNLEPPRPLTSSQLNEQGVRIYIYIYMSNLRYPDLQYPGTSV